MVTEWRWWWEKCGNLMWQGVGSSLRGFLDHVPAFCEGGHVLPSHGALRSCALLLARSAAGQPWPRPCRESCVGKQKGDDDSSGVWVPGGSAVKQNGPGSPCVRWCEHWGRRQELFPWFCLQHSGTKSSHTGWAKLFFLYYSKLITCKPHDSLTVPGLLLQQQQSQPRFVSSAFCVTS